MISMLLAGVLVAAGAEATAATDGVSCRVESHAGDALEAAQAVYLEVTPESPESTVIAACPEGPVTVTARLQQLCAEDGGPCLDKWYLTTTYATFTTQAGTTTLFSPGEPFAHHQTLSLGDWHTFLNCRPAGNSPQ